MKILTILLTYDGHAKYLVDIYKRIGEFHLPPNTTNDILVCASEKDVLLKDLCTKNNFNAVFRKVDFSGLEDYNTDPRYRSPDTGMTFKQMYDCVERRNFCISFAQKNNYDYLLSVDGDVLPEKEGLFKLLQSGKVFVGAPVSAVLSKPNNAYTVPKYDQGTGLHQFRIMGNCFLLRNKTTFDILYKLPDNVPLSSESASHCKRLTEAGFEIWGDTDIDCEHYDKK